MLILTILRLYSFFGRAVPMLWPSLCVFAGFCQRVYSWLHWPAVWLRRNKCSQLRIVLRSFLLLTALNHNQPLKSKPFGSNRPPVQIGHQFFNKTTLHFMESLLRFVFHSSDEDVVFNDALKTLPNDSFHVQCSCSVLQPFFKKVLNRRYNWNVIMCSFEAFAFFFLSRRFPIFTLPGRAFCLCALI